jgi:hypothetical protein
VTGPGTIGVGSCRSILLNAAKYARALASTTSVASPVPV